MKKKLIRITTVPISLEKLLEGQLSFMNNYYEVVAVSAEKEYLEKYGRENMIRTFWVEMTREITPFKDLKAVIKLYNFLRKEKPAIVHTHTPKAGIVGMLAAKIAGVPIRLHTVAGMPLMEATGFKRKLLNVVEKLTCQFATKVYPNSHGLKDFILAEGFAGEEKLEVLGKGSSNGIDTRYFDPESFSKEQRNQKRIELGIPEKDLVFIFVGRLVKEKGINELVAAFSKLNEIDNNVSLLLVGPYEQDLDPLSPETLQEIEKHPKIISTGFQADVRPYLNASDIMTFPSYREGFPNVIMQAGAMGLASIVTDINGCNEIVSHDYNGMIIPVKNEEELLSALKLIIENPAYAKQLRKNSREVICRHYEREEYWQVLLREYKKLESQPWKS